MTLRRLETMSNARRRDEWDRWSRLLALVEVGTNWSSEPITKRPIDYWPKELIPPEWNTGKATPRNATNSRDAYDRLKAAALRGKR